MKIAIAALALVISSLDAVAILKTLTTNNLQPFADDREKASFTYDPRNYTKRHETRAFFVEFRVISWIVLFGLIKEWALYGN